MSTEEVFVALGSNIGDSTTIVEEAIVALSKIRGVELKRRSSLYRCEPVGNIPQDDYINAVALLVCDLEPTPLLLELQSIENAYYRRRDQEQRWAPRTLDLDIILFGNRTHHDSHLSIPHPEFTNRRFVLEPMFEIDGDRFVTGYGSLSYLIEQAPILQMERLVDE